MNEPNQPKDPRIGTLVRGQLQGWRANKMGELSAPLLDAETPLYQYGILGSRETPFGTAFTIGREDVVPETVQRVPEGVSYPRSDYQFVGEVVDRGYKWRSKLRMLQSWYREYVLGLPPGTKKAQDVRSRTVLSRLPKDAVEQDPTLNFLCDPEIEKRARKRLGDKGMGGIVWRDRLYHDLLSSQPLCFNLFGFLDVERPKEPNRGEAYPLLHVLNEVFGVHADAVEDVRFEYGPRERGVKSGSAFDCFIEYQSGHNRGFVGIECKYSEDLARQRPTSLDKNPEYRSLTEAGGSGFTKGAADSLNVPKTCQLLYNSCLALRFLRSNEFQEARVLMLSCSADPEAKAATELVQEQREERDDFVKWASYEDIVEVVRQNDELEAWSDHFTQRYLDLSPVNS